MRTTLLAISILAASIAFPIAAAQEPTPGPQTGCPSDLPPEAWKACSLGTAVVGDPTNCDGADGKAVCATGGCPVSNSRVNPNSGCNDFVCTTPDWSVTPEGGDDCLDMICRNVPPVIEIVKIQLAPIVTLLGTIPGATIARALVKNAGFSCDPGSGGPGGPGNGCQRVLATPVGSVGADPNVIVTPAQETGDECSWARSGVGGYSYVGDAGHEVAVYPGGDCAVDVHVTVILGYNAQNYHVSDSCS